MLKAELCYSSERKVPHKKVAVLFGRPSLTFTQRSFYTSLHAHMYTIEDDFRGTIKNDQCFFLCYVNQFNLMFSAHWPLLSMVFNGFWVPQPSPWTDFQPPNHWFQWFFNGFGVPQPSPWTDFQPQNHWFQWSWTIGPTMRWFRWIVHL